jgi:hypothetical protein
VFIDDVTYTSSFIPGPPAWNINGSGDWNTGSNWDSASAPNGIGAEAALAGVITSPQTVFTDSPITLGMLKFDNLNTYVLSGVGSLTMQVNNSNALVNVVKGTHKINLPLTIASNTTLSVASGATLKLSDPVIINPGNVLSQTGSGSVVYESTVTVLGGSSLEMQSSAEAAAISLQGRSSARIAPHGAAPIRVLRAGQIMMSPDATLDLSDNAAVIGEMEEAQARQLLQSGQITSSMADAHQRLGYLSNPDGMLIRFTWAGDSNLDGTVDVADLASLASHWQGTAATWVGGDFDYNGLVNVADLGLLASNWQINTNGPLQQVLSEFGLPSAAVPEPAGAGMALATILLGARVRLRQRCRGQRER